jgi:uncharacterized protein involved in type VI secretion and phage assembly
MERDLLQLLVELVRGRFFGKYRGTVVDNQDATSKGRLKVRVPSVLAALEVWAMPCVPYAGAGVGFVSLPPVGAGVWVEFEAGDPSFPVWVGCFWADGEAPEHAQPSIKVWRTDKHTVRLDDDTPELKIATDEGAQITMAADLVAEAGNGKVTVDGSGVTTEAGGQMVEVSPSSVSVNSGALEVC